MKEIPLTQGKVALVDDVDYEALAAFKWYAYRQDCTFYAKRMVVLPDGRRSAERLHRVVLSRKLGRPLARNEMPDHEHGDGLDNRREELRLATKAQNGRNCNRHSSSPSSRFLGVCRHSDLGGWRVRIQINGKMLHLGGYATELEAALAREYYVVAHPELMARSNFTQSELAI